LRKHILQGGQRTALFGHQQDAGCFLVQAVHQFQEPGLGPGAAQLLDHAETDPAAAMHGHARRLVDRQHRIVFKQHGELARGHGSGLLVALFRQTQGGHAHLVTHLQSGVGRRPALVDPHLAAADDAIDQGLGRALEHLDEEVVETLPDTALVNREALHGCRHLDRRRTGGDDRLGRHPHHHPLAHGARGRFAGGFPCRSGCVFRTYNGLGHVVNSLCVDMACAVSTTTNRQDQTAFYLSSRTGGAA
jgi:hypothetical protein